jgi:hypothetical protein
MPQIAAFECEECGVLGRASEGNAPPEGWLYVSTQVMGEEAEPAVIFCTEKCRGLHFRPIQRRKGNGAESDEEGHSSS